MCCSPLGCGWTEDILYTKVAAFLNHGHQMFDGLFGDKWVTVSYHPAPKHHLYNKIS